MRRRTAPAAAAALLGITLLAIALVAPTVSAESTGFVAPMSHAQEVGVVNAPGAGGMASFRLEGSTLHYRIDVRRLTSPAVMSHIHGPAGRHADAGVSVWLCQTAAFPGPSGTPQCQATTNGLLVSGSVAVTADQIALLESGQAYVNVHTGTHLPGEIRGQVVPVAGS